MMIKIELASCQEILQTGKLGLQNHRGAFGGTRGSRPVPPEKGVFPLDHMHECGLEKKEYLDCLKTSGHNSGKCREFSKKYLQCRMEKNLMAKQDMSELGFRKDQDIKASEGKENDKIGE